MAKTDVAAQPQTKLPATSVDDEFAAHAGAGMESATGKDLLIPRLGILQALSPQVQRKKAEYIEGAEVGDIADLGMGEVFKEGVLFLPVLFKKEWLEWSPRDTGKGLVAIHADPSIMDLTTRNDKNQPVLANGNLISETAQFFGLNLSARRRRCYVPMTSTQLKKARKWLTMAMDEKLARADGSEFTPPMYYRSYLLGSADEANSQGDWAGWTVKRGASLPEMGDHWRDIKANAAEFLEMITSGTARADLSGVEGEGSSATAGEEGAM